MFNLGFKQIVINRDAVVTSVSGEIVIEGYGKFGIGTSTSNVTTAVVAPTLGITTCTFAWTGLDTITVHISANDRLQGSVRRRFSFQAKDVADLVAVLGNLTGVGSAMDYPFIFDGTNTFSMKAGYEGYSIYLITQEAPAGNNNESGDVADITGTVTAGKTGVGNGKQLEAEVQHGTHANLDPYGINVGGNETVDIKATYTTIDFFIPANLVSDSWEPHSMIGYGDANTEAEFADVAFTAYCKVGDADAAAALIATI